MSISSIDQIQLNSYDAFFETDSDTAHAAIRNWTLLKLRLLSNTSLGDSRFTELSAEIDQLRLHVQPSMYTPSRSSSVAPSLTSADKPFFFLTSYETLPMLYNPVIKEVYAFLTKLERMFTLRNYELQLPRENTAGWTNYAVLRLSGTAETWATTKWGVSPDLEWAVFRQALVSEFISDSAIRELSAGYIGLTAKSNSSITDFNDSFREFRLLLAFVGKAVEEKAAIRDYEEKIRQNKKVALAFTQFLTVEKIVEKASVVSLADAMNYCENVDSI